MNTYFNIFCKKRNHVWKLAPNPQISMILASIQDGELVNFNQLSERLFNNKDNDILTSKKDIEFFLDEAIKQNFVAEIHGIRVNKWIEEFIK